MQQFPDKAYPMGFQEEQESRQAPLFPENFGEKVQAAAQNSGAQPVQEPSGPRQSGIVFYLAMVADKLLMVVLGVLCLSPLCLVKLCWGSPLVWLGLLCLPLLLLVMVPLRYSFADALVQPRENSRHFSLAKAFNLRDGYGEKLHFGLLNLLRNLLWGIPTLGLLGYCGWWGITNYYGTNVLTMMSSLEELGQVKYTVMNFFLRLFGQAEVTVPAHTLADSFVVVGAAFLLTLVIWFFGACRNAGYRYVWAWSRQQGCSFSQGYQKQIKGRRGGHALVCLMNLVLWIPFLLVVYFSFKPVLSDLSQNFLEYVMTKSFPLKEIATSLLPAALAYVFLYLFVLPARNWLNARFFSASPRREVRK